MKITNKEVNDVEAKLKAMIEKLEVRPSDAENVARSYLTNMVKECQRIKEMIAAVQRLQGS